MQLARLSAAALALLVLALVAALARADESSHQYAQGEGLYLWVNKVGPHSNPHETYSYFTLYSMCEPKFPVERSAGLGEALHGNALIRSKVLLHFGQNQKDVVWCTATLDKLEAARFAVAAAHRYWYEVFVDDLPAWGNVGALKRQGREPLLFTHMKLTVEYNEDRIVGFRVADLDPVPVTIGQPVSFTFSVEWEPSEASFADRFDRYLDDRFFEHRAHWFALANSFMLALFLITIVALLLARIVKRDIGLSADEIEADDAIGWKRLVNDAFRPPSSPGLLAALLGTGAQLIVLAGIVVFLVVGIELYTVRGSITSLVLVFYCLTSVIGGAVSGAVYRRLGGDAWIRTAVFTAAMLPVLVTLAILPLNFVAVAYSSLAAIPFRTIIATISLWLFIGLPLSVVGTLFGRHRYGLPVVSVPPATAKAPPPRPAYLSPTSLALVAGVLPFGTIFIETYFVLASFGAYKTYYVYGFMFLVSLFMIAVTSCCCIFVTYLFLNTENHRWPWFSFASGASTALYVYVYTLYYFFFRTHMHGLLQTSFFFGYAFLACLVLALVCGTVGVLSAYVFTRVIYSSIKNE